MTSALTARPKFVTVGDNSARAFSMGASERAVALAIKAGLEPAAESEAGRSTIYADLNWNWDPEWLVALAGMPASVLTKDGFPVLAHIPADGDPAPVLAAMLGESTLFLPPMMRAEAAERDARRYRWLRGHAVRCLDNPDTNYVGSELRFRFNHLCDETLDAAIDAAIATTEQADED